MKMNWLMFPITENGKTDYYMTDAPPNILTKMFLQSENVNELIEILQEMNFEIGKYFPYVSLDFDSK
ncbi:hypothetical protein [Bacillus phage vB_BanS-Thrax1]|nr:hypothetical protein [Bacillus phage vB_BanS-Thrax1]